ncbi:RNA-binding S4 domain-containing protein [Pelagibius litoralis]|uniref:RNA-binding S4 domain-containing protein n=1 Tax=Pelagibius litoralis TaxID=374515 RepID=A0A967F177_9PROT|nr:RNA-binding S4 domain-containing protein [Pelagibius litoralis]NIA71095.1 RNA-binding S4 domain-containing protein [Pelagibius litoralis]
MSETGKGLRADKWLWYARFFKTRSLASKVCQAGKLRLSGQGVVKPHHKVRAGDVLTFPQACHIRVIRVVALAERRGPASEAQALYEDLKPPEAESRLPRGTPSATAKIALRDPGTGRPTKRERRDLDRLREPE